MFTLLFLQTMTSNAKCCWCKCTSPDVVLFSCDSCHTPGCSTARIIKYTCAPCFHGATGTPPSTKNTDWACNTCMKDKNSRAYRKAAATNYYNYHKEKDAAALGVKTRASVRVISTVAGKDEEESAKDSPKKKKDKEEEESANNSPKKKKDPPEKEEEESANNSPKKKKAKFPVAEVPAHDKVR